MEKVLRLLNVQADTNQKLILLSIFVSGLLGTYISPALTKAIISELPAEWLAFSSLFSSIVGLLLGMMWRGKFRKGIMNYFILFCVIECIAGFLCGMYLCFIKYNVWVLAITTLIYGNFITSLVGKCIMAFKAKLWVEKERELYDNNLSVVGGITCIIGFGFALIAMPSLKMALFIWGACCIFDDLGWIAVYVRNKQTLKEIE